MKTRVHGCDGGMARWTPLTRAYVACACAGFYDVAMEILMSDMAGNARGGFEDIPDVVINGKSFGQGCTPSPRYGCSVAQPCVVCLA